VIHCGLTTGDEKVSAKKILVVDDEPEIRNILDQALTRSGYAVRSVESAEAALDILKQDKIKVIFLDLNLPGMNGVELGRQIRKDNPMAVIHAITGYGSQYDVFDCRKAGFDDYFTKPFDLKTLIKAAHDAFEKIDRWAKSGV